MLPDGRTSFQALQNAFSGGAPLPRLLRLRPALARRCGPLRAPAARAKGCAGGAPLGRARPRPLRAAPEGTRRRGAAGGVPRRPGGDRLEAGRPSPTGPGRSAAWTKAKCIARQELVIGGFTDPEGSREGSARCWWATTRAARSASRGRSAPASRRLRARAPRPARAARDPRAALRPAAGGPAGTGCTLGEAGAGRGGGVHGVDLRREDPAPVVPGAPRGQARRGGGAGGRASSGGGRCRAAHRGGAAETGVARRGEGAPHRREPPPPRPRRRPAPGPSARGRLLQLVRATKGPP